MAARGHLGPPTGREGHAPRRLAELHRLESLARGVETWAGLGARVRVRVGVRVRVSVRLGLGLGLGFGLGFGFGMGLGLGSGWRGRGDLAAPSR